MESVTYPKCIQDKINELMEDVRRVEACAALGRICDEVQAEFPGTRACMPSIGRLVHYVTIEKSLEEAVAIIRAYRNRGVKMIKYEDRPEHHCREYYMEGVSVYASLQVGDKESADSCQFVKVGTKTVEQPVYEVRCGAGAAP